MRHKRTSVKKLASRECASEPVVLTPAQNLQVEIVYVPSTPASASAPWAFSTYKTPLAACLPHVVLGNSDVHNMWLAPLVSRACRVNLVFCGNRAVCGRRSGIITSHACSPRNHGADVFTFLVYQIHGGRRTLIGCWCRFFPFVVCCIWRMASTNHAAQQTLGSISSLHQCRSATECWTTPHRMHRMAPQGQPPAAWRLSGTISTTEVLAERASDSFNQMQAVPGIREVRWQTTKTSQNNVGKQYSEQNALVFLSDVP